MRPASAWKLALIGAGIVGLVLAATATLRGGVGKLSSLAYGRCSERSPGAGPSLPAAAGHAAPTRRSALLGHHLRRQRLCAAAFSAPITDPTSLIEHARLGRGPGSPGDRLPGGQARRLPPGDPATPSRRTNIHLLIGVAADVRRENGTGGRAVRPGAGGRSGAVGACAGPTWTPCGASPPCGAARSRTAWPAATSRAASSRWPPPPSTAGPPALGRRSSTSPGTSGSGPRTWASGGS